MPVQSIHICLNVFKSAIRLHSTWPFVTPEPPEPIVTRPERAPAEAMSDFWSQIGCTHFTAWRFGRAERR